MTKLYLSSPLSNKDIDDPSGGRNGLFVKKLCLIDCARLAESVWVPAITDRCRSPEFGVILTKLRELREPKFQKTTETSFSLFAPKIWTCDCSWNSWIGQFRRNSSPGVTVNFLIDYRESSMQLSWRQGNELPGLEINCSILIISDDWLVVKRMCSSSDYTGSESWENSKCVQYFDKNWIKQDLISTRLSGIHPASVIFSQDRVTAGLWATEPPESEQKPNPQQSLHFPFILSFFQKVDWIIPVDLLLIAPVYFGPGSPGEPSNYFAI